MKPIWLIEYFEDRDSSSFLIEEIEKQGYEYHAVEYAPFQPGLLDKVNGNCVVTQTTINLAQQIIRHKPHWIPGPWLNASKYKCSSYYPYLGKYLFNDRYVMMPRSEITRNMEHLYSWLGVNDTVFIRPDSGLKPFTAQLFDKANFHYNWSWVEQFTDPESLLVISSPKSIRGEWRFVVSEGRVIAGSQYELDGRFDCSPEFPATAMSLAEEAAKLYQPDPIFVVDICLGWDWQYYVLEIGSFSCAGLYACDMSKIVEYASDLAVREHEDIQNI